MADLYEQARLARQKAKANPGWATHPAHEAEHDTMLFRRTNGLPHDPSALPEMLRSRCKWADEQCVRRGDGVNCDGCGRGNGSLDRTNQGVTSPELSATPSAQASSQIAASTTVVARTVDFSSWTAAGAGPSGVPTDALATSDGLLVFVYRSNSDDSQEWIEVWSAPWP